MDVTAFDRHIRAAGQDPKDAACIDYHPDVFFPTRGGETGPAKRICFGCPLREACLDYALVAGGKFGVWGATSERERRRMRRALRAVA